MKRGHCTSLVRNGADDDEIADAIDDEIRGALGPALASVLDEMTPAPPQVLHTEITAFVGLVGQGWTAAGRTEFISLAMRELDSLPGDMVLDALARARRRVHDGRLLVSWVCEDVEPRAAKLEVECETLTKLAKLT